MLKLIEITKDTLGGISNPLDNYLFACHKEFLYVFGKGSLIRPLRDSIIIYPNGAINVNWSIKQRKDIEEEYLGCGVVRGLFKGKNKTFFEVTRRLIKYHGLIIPEGVAYLLIQHGNNALKKAFKFSARQIRTNFEGITKRQKRTLGAFLYKSFRDVVPR